MESQGLLHKKSMRKLFFYNVSGITIFAVGALVLFLATKAEGGGKLLLVLTGNALFVLGVLVLIFYAKLGTDTWRGKVNLFVRTLVYATLLIFATVVLMVNVGL